MSRIKDYVATKYRIAEKMFFDKVDSMIDNYEGNALQQAQKEKEYNESCDAQQELLNNKLSYI